ncbi:hypothetical protein [Chitinophaga sp. S165]|uniref:hypothetical protein n=1 Tax=Chitinophaga sp. S165 TaxID=2135462 RepID=UPI000D70C52B|nr:hypothetical protein [Chitinophaga sp. S165]PWV47006.1 hypothetical protein C7475_10993 [Chitinophaga sp. S165]
MSENNVPIQSNNTNNRGNPLNMELLREIADNQKQELKYKQQELAIRLKEITMTHQLSMKNIDVHAEHLRNSPKYVFKLKFMAYSLAVIVLLILIVFFSYCLYSGNKEIVMRVIEIIVTALLSGSSGYVLGKTKNERTEAETSSSG